MIRNLALQHTSSICVSDMCLLCEMGYLFDMLEKAQGAVCQATNLLKTFSSNPLGKSAIDFSYYVLTPCKLPNTDC